MELRRDLTGVMIALVSAPVLHPSKAKDVEELVHQDALMTGLVEIREGFPEPGTQEVCQGELTVGQDLLEGDRFPLVAVVDLLPGFVVLVDDLCFSHIGDVVTRFDGPTAPGEVFQACEGFVVGVLLPKGLADGGVSIVGVGVSLGGDGGLGEVFAEELALGIVVGRSAGLPAVAEGDLRVLEGLDELFEPVGVEGVAVGAGDDDDLARCSGDAGVEGAAKGEILGADVDNFDGVTLSNSEGFVGGTRVDDDDFRVRDSLLGDSVEQPSEVLLFVECSNYN